MCVCVCVCVCLCITAIYIIRRDFSCPNQFHLFHFNVIYLLIFIIFTFRFKMCMLINDIFRI